MSEAKFDSACLPQTDRLIWAAIAAVAAIVFAAPLLSDFRIDWWSFAPPAATALLLAIGAWFYHQHRPDPRLATALTGTAQAVTFAAVAAPLSYLAASFNRPLFDAAFATADRALGLDWPALLAWMNHHPAPHAIFVLAYNSFAVQATTTVLALAFTGRLLQMRVFMISFMLAAIVSIAISAIAPAAGVWDFYQFKPDDFSTIVPATRAAQPFFDGLRDGSYRFLTGITAQGIITFPSFHAALGVVFMTALWPIPVVRWAGIAVNGLMILATPVDGGHYVVDVIAGIAVAIICIIAARQIVARVISQRTLAASGAIKTPHTIH
jgi:membrane-associated phospholipid phosphatase